MKRFKLLSCFLATATLILPSAVISATKANAANTVSDGRFHYAYTDSGWTLYSYIGTDTDITLPVSFGGFPVEGIDENCFSHSSVTSVIIPEGYTFVDSYAFYDCADLYSVVLPSTVTDIGSGAFSNSGLTGADLSNTSINVVSSYLFKDCTALESVALPDSVTSIGEYAFYNTAIGNINIPSSTLSIDRYAFAQTASLDTVSLSDKLESIGDSCFENSAVSQINLPESLTSIGTSAFRNATSLKNLYIPDSVTTIGGYAFFPMSVQSKIHIDCFKDSCADAYCYENFVMDYTAFDKLMGDADLNGVININDATAIQRHCAYIKMFTPQQRVTADVNNDGKINILDATSVQRILLHYQDPNG